MSEAVQDVRFDESDPPEVMVRKLRILQNEVVRLSRLLSPIGVTDAGAVDFGTVSVDSSSLTVPASASGFLEAVVNGQRVRIPVFP